MKFTKIPMLKSLIFFFEKLKKKKKKKVGGRGYQTGKHLRM
jgi:hypothetical protein